MKKIFINFSLIVAGGLFVLVGYNFLNTLNEPYRTLIPVILFIVVCIILCLCVIIALVADIMEMNAKRKRREKIEDINTKE